MKSSKRSEPKSAKTPRTMIAVSRTSEKEKKHTGTKGNEKKVLGGMEQSKQTTTLSRGAKGGGTQPVKKRKA